MDALLALVDSLGALPGRKTVVYLCEGLTIPPSVEPRFRSVIDTANRRNVSLYAMDAAGLRVHSQQTDTKNQLDELTKTTVDGVERPNNGKWTEDLERNETLLKSDPAAALGILTSQTGGLLIQNTNDLEKGIQRIDEDRRFHYLLGYTSSNPTMDGTLPPHRRQGEALAASRRTRDQGYVALPADTGAPVLVVRSAGHRGARSVPQADGVSDSGASDCRADAGPSRFDGGHGRRRKPAR